MINMGTTDGVLVLGARGALSGCGVAPNRRTGGGGTKVVTESVATGMTRRMGHLVDVAFGLRPTAAPYQVELLRGGWVGGRHGEGRPMSFVHGWWIWTGRL